MYHHVLNELLTDGKTISPPHLGDPKSLNTHIEINVATKSQSFFKKSHLNPQN